MNSPKKGVETGSEIAKKGVETGSEFAKKGINKINETKQKMNKKTKVLTSIIAVIVVIVIIVSVYFTQIKKTDVDVLEDIKIEYTGVSGQAKAQIDKASIKIFDNPKINDFVNNHIEFNILPNENLKEGDTIKVVIEPDISAMKDNKINISNIQKEFKVMGLDKYPDSLQDLPNLKTFIDASQQAINENAKSTYYDYGLKKYKDIKTSYVETCFVKDIERSKYNLEVIQIYNIFKITYATKYDEGKWENESYFNSALNDKDVILNSKGELKEELSFSIEYIARNSINDVKSKLPDNAKCEVVK